MEVLVVDKKVTLVDESDSRLASAPPGLETCAKEDQIEIEKLLVMMTRLHYHRDSPHDPPTELLVQMVGGHYYILSAFGYLDLITLEELQSLRDASPRVVKVGARLSAVGSEDPTESRGSVEIHLETRAWERTRKRNERESQHLADQDPSAKRQRT